MWFRKLRTYVLGRLLDVFRDSGEYLGRIALPMDMNVSRSGPVAAATRDFLYYVPSDPLDVPHIVRVKTVRPK